MIFWEGSGDIMSWRDLRDLEDFLRSEPYKWPASSHLPLHPTGLCWLPADKKGDGNNDVRNGESGIVEVAIW